MELTIEQVKRWRKQINAMHMVVFVVDENGQYLFGHQGDGDKPEIIMKVIDAISGVVNVE